MGVIAAMYAYMRRRRNRQHQDEMRDETMAASFPASDPPPF